MTIFIKGDTPAHDVEICENCDKAVEVNTRLGVQALRHKANKMEFCSVDANDMRMAK